ncbi:MAG: thioredoxin [Oscillospiraceae bacterium]|jgi:thioredoxin 1|nr:thioredoxin [Oscillospiraceae bacterium]
MAIVHLTTETFEDAIASGATLVDFWAAWCGPCRMVAPVIEELAEEYAGSVNVAKVDVDENGEIAEGLSIGSIPTVVFFRDGKEVGRIIGARDKEDYALLLQ